MLHDKATTSQPLGRCFESRGGEGGGEPSAPLPVLAAERIPERGETRLTTDPLPPRSPSPGLSEGRKAAFFRLPHRNVASWERERSWARVEASNRFAHGPGVESEHGLGGVLLEGLLGVLFNSSAAYGALPATGPAVFSTGPLPGSSGLLTFPKGEVVNYLGT